MKKTLLTKHLLILMPLVLASLFAYTQTQIGNDIDGTGADDRSGTSVATSADGTIVAIGAPNNDDNGSDSGLVRIYQNQGGVWIQIGGDIYGEAADDKSGTSVALSANGSIVAIGAPKNDGAVGLDSGHVRVYQNEGGTWVQIGIDIDGKARNDESGYSVSLSLDGKIVAIGAPFSGDNSLFGTTGFRGQVSVYENQAGIWTQIGSDLNGEAAADGFGTSVSLSLSGKTVAIGAPGYDYMGGHNNGHVRVYKYLGGNWTQMGDGISSGTGDESGSSVSLGFNGLAVAIGAEWADGNGFASGRVRVYRYHETSKVWYRYGGDIDGEGTPDKSGISVSLSLNADIVAIGAAWNTGINGSYSGHVRIYQLQNNVWTQIGVDIDGENSGDLFGTSVSLALNGGNTVAIGGILNDGDGSNGGVGHVRIYDLTTAFLNLDETVLSQFTIFLNPIVNTLQIKINAGLQLEGITIYNALGQFIKEETRTSVIDVSELKRGLYFIEIKTNRGKASKKIILQ